MPLNDTNIGWVVVRIPRKGTDLALHVCEHAVPGRGDGRVLVDGPVGLQRQHLRARRRVPHQLEEAVRARQGRADLVRVEAAVFLIPGVGGGEQNKKIEANMWEIACWELFFFF